MKHRLLPLLLVLPALPAIAQTAALTVEGTSLTVQAGTSLHVQGDVLHKPGGPLQNDGTVELTGNLTSTATAGSLLGSGLLRFAGTQQQTLYAPAGTTLGSLTVANTAPAGQNRVLLPADLTLTGALTLTNGLLRTAPTATLTLPDGATFAGEAPGRVVQGNLRVLRSIGSGVIDFSLGLALDRTGLGAVTVTRTAGLQTAGLSYGQLGSSRSIDAVWQVQAAAVPAAPVSFTLSWPADFDNGLTDFSQARLWRAATAAGPWEAVGAPAPANSRSLTGTTTALGAFTVSNAQNPLPVDLIRFTAERRNNDAVLRWTTAQERNNAYFVVESSVNGITFNAIGRVAGLGTTSRSTNYTFTDAGITRYQARLVYYRLRQVDTDGQQNLSPVRSVAPKGSALVLEVFPNPTHDDKVTLSGAEAGAEVYVYDATGRQVFQGRANTAGLAELHLPPGLKTGIYIVRSGSLSSHLQVE